MSQLEIPRFGALLAPFISQVPHEAMPRFLALLERGAADRYREWANTLPDHAEVLLPCAASEDAIADLIEAAFTLDPSLRDAVIAPFLEPSLPTGMRLAGSMGGIRCASRPTQNGKVRRRGAISRIRSTSLVCSQRWRAVRRSRKPAQKLLDEFTIPRLKSQEGFVRGVWLRSNDQSTGRGVVLCDTEEHASATAAVTEQGPPPGAPVTVRSVDLFEVIGEA